MSEINLVFPGQGSQFVGMARNLMETTIAKEMMEKADETLGFSISKLMLAGPSEQLGLTTYTQPAIVTHSLILFELLKEILKKKNYSVHMVLGHSVGEYSALSTAGVMSFEQALLATHTRGKAMQEAVPAGRGCMYALLKAPLSIVEKACRETQGIVEIANYNSEKQVVISGQNEACQAALLLMEKMCKQENLSSIRAIKLAVSAPFHSSMMKPAEEKMTEFFKAQKLCANKLPYIANYDAQLYPVGTTGEKIQDNLIKQICGSVLWTQSIQKLENDYKIIEVGPGSVLKGLMKSIDSKLNVLSFDPNFSWQQTTETIDQFL